jgi:hypothetical protein
MHLLLHEKKGLERTERAVVQFYLTVRYGKGKMSNEYFDEYNMQPFPLRIKGGDCNEIFSLLIPLTQKKLASKNIF